MTELDELLIDLAACTDEKYGFQYFLQNYCYISTPAGVEKMVPTQMQLAFAGLMDRTDRAMWDGDRADGKTTILAAYAYWKATFFYESNVVIGIHNNGACQGIMARLKVMHTSLKEKYSDILGAVSIIDKHRIEFTNRSRITVTPNVINNIRGKSIDTLLLDEASLFNGEDIRDRGDYFMAVTSGQMKKGSKMFGAATCLGDASGSQLWKRLTTISNPALLTRHLALIAE